MRRLLMTSAMLMPLLAAGGYAQEAQTEATEPEAGTDVEVIEVQEAEEPQATEGEAMEAEPAEGEAVEVQIIDAEPVEAEPVEGEAMDAEPVEVEVVEEAAPPAEAIVREQAAEELRIDWITGANVTSPDGDGIGSVNDVIVDGETGQLKAAILSVGGFLGIGAKQIAVAWDQLQINYDANEITVDLTKDQADAAPEYIFREQELPPAPAGTDPAAGGGGLVAPEGTAPQN